MKRKLLIISILMLLTGIAIILNPFSKQEVSTLPKADKVLVLKSKREMYLMRNGEVIKKYKISLGDSPVGHKVKEGDEKTPEGNYILDWRNSKSSCYKSIHISYPNKDDKQRAKALNVSPGGDIMIHGLHPSIAGLGSLHTIDDWTNGCIAVSNEEMDEIWKSVKNGTAIEIRK